MPTRVGLYLLAAFLQALLLGACGSDSLTATPVTSASVTTPTPVPTPTIEEVWQANWLKGSACKPLCWEGIIPGKTRAREALNILQGSSLIKSANLTVQMDNGEVSWKRPGDRVSIGWATFKGNDPNNPILTIYPNGLMKFKMGEVIKAYGEPSHIFGLAMGNEQGDRTDYHLDIIYLNQGFSLSMSGSTKPVLREDSILDRLSLFEPENYDYNQKFRVPWQGFKDFDFYCRARYATSDLDCPLGRTSP